MKKSLATLTGVLSLAMTLPAIAGPDWKLIEHGRKAKATRTEQAAVQQTQTSGGGALSAAKSMSKEQMMRECAEMMKKS